MKKKWLVGFLIWNIIILILVCFLSRADRWREKEETQFIAQEGTEELIRLSGDDEIIFRFQNPYSQIDNMILRFGQCNGHTEGELSVTIYDDKVEYYRYTVPVYAFSDEAFYLYTNEINGLIEKREYSIRIAVSGVDNEGLVLYGISDKDMDIQTMQSSKQDYSSISPFWGAGGVHTMLSKEFAAVFWVWFLLDVFFIVCVMSLTKCRFVACGIFLLFLVVTLIAIFIYGERTKEERIYDYWTHRNVAEFVPILIREGEIRQTFVAGYNRLEEFILLFDNYQPDDEATVYVVLEDKSGEVYYNWNVGVKYLGNNTFTLIGMVEEELRKGEEYLLRIYLDIPDSNITVRAVAQEDMHASLNKLSVGSKERTGEALYLYQKYQVTFSYVQVWCVILSVTALLYLFVLLCKAEWLWKAWDKLNIIFVVLISYYNIESLSGNLSVIGMAYVLGNCLTILSVYLIIRAVFKKKADYIVVIFALIIGMANFYVLQFRGSELLLTDIKSVFTAISVVGNYDFTLPPVVYTSILLTVAFLFVQGIININGRPAYKKEKAPVQIACLASGMILVVTLFFSLDVDKFYSFTISNNFREYGWCYSNLYIARFSAIEKPKGYSDKRVEEILRYVNEEVNKYEKREVVQPKNLIVIMNESLSDLSILGELETNQDYMPYIRNLSENTIKGNLFVSTFGGNTCITEYEFLTGNSLYFMPTGTIPYQNVCEEQEEGLVKILQAQDYYAVAMHPYGPSNWERDEVYPAMGFDEFLSLEDYEGAELIRNYVSDQADYQKIIDYYENFDKDKNLFVFNVTMQNHGGYDINNGVMDTNIKIQNFESSIGETYLSLISESDKAFEYLLEYFSKVDEPTMIVMFGDHMPALPDSFYECIYGDELEDIGKWRRSLRYITPYVIWTNYDSDFEPIEDISTNYLGSYVLQCAGLEMPKYNEFLLQQRKRVPVLAMGGAYDLEGNYIVNEEVPDDWLSDYKILQYMRLEDRKSKLYNIFSVEE